MTYRNQDLIYKAIEKPSRELTPEEIESARRWRLSVSKNQGRPKIKIDDFDLSLCFNKYLELVGEGKKKHLAIEKVRRLLLTMPSFAELNPDLRNFSTRTIRRWFDKMKKAGQKPFMDKTPR